MELEQVDRAALAAAIELARADPELQIDDVLRTRSWEEVGLFAAGLCQARSLKLKPWECPPCDTTNVTEPSNCYGCRANEVTLLRKMLSLGLSRYDPSPLSSMERAERERVA
jgi:hypothetical protein